MADIELCEFYEGLENAGPEAMLPPGASVGLWVRGCWRRCWVGRWVGGGGGGIWVWLSLRRRCADAEWCGSAVGCMRRPCRPVAASPC